MPFLLFFFLKDIASAGKPNPLRAGKRKNMLSGIGCSCACHAWEQQLLANLM